MAVRHIPEAELFHRLQDWEAKQPSPPTLWDAVCQDDGLILAAYITRHFRKAAKEAVLSRWRVEEIRRLAFLAFKGDAAATEQFLRAPILLFGRTPLEATVESSASMDEALRSLAIYLREHALSLFDRLAASWALTGEERALLFGAQDEKVDHWRSQPSKMPLEAVARALSLLFTHKAIVRLCETSEAVGEWLRAPRSAPPFREDSALTLILTEGRQGNRVVCEYLEREVTFGPS